MTCCNVCQRELSSPIYESQSDTSIDSLCALHASKTRVYFCGECGHLQTDELPDLAGYYDERYKILADSVEEDQLYKEEQGRRVFRAEHQAETLLKRVPLAPLARVLDFGCAKGATARQLIAQSQSLEVSLFDVSDRYVSFWNEFAPAARQAVYRTPADWQASFDLVCSFFVLEHVSDLLGVLGAMHDLLSPGGYLYFVVPNAQANIGDFVVADHVNHFTPASIRTALARSGFDDVEIDAEAHEAALVVVAQRSSRPIAVVAAPREEIDRLSRWARSTSGYWQGVAQEVQRFEVSHGLRGPKIRAAIYGSGFYGTFIASCLSRLDAVDCFLDRNPYRQGKQLLGKPVIAPEALGDDTNVVYVGLNPRVARNSIEAVAAWADRRHDYFFL